MVAGPLLFLSLVVLLAARRFKSAESESLPTDHNAEEDIEERGRHRGDINRPKEPLNNPRGPIEEPVL